ncbi:MAG: hypothetical protein HC902_05820 [Calothrix sp. SM1_5_4]|nr:hypothetical protein [Calothrix sp. SM1_5_4]
MITRGVVMPFSSRRGQLDAAHVRQPQIRDNHVAKVILRGDRFERLFSIVESDQVIALGTKESHEQVLYVWIIIDNNESWSFHSPSLSMGSFLPQVQSGTIPRIIWKKYRIWRKA